MTDKKVMLDQLNIMMDEVKNGNVTDLIMIGKHKKLGKVDSIISDPVIALGLVECLHIDAKNEYLKRKKLADIRDNFLNNKNPEWGLDEDGEFYYKNLEKD